MPVVDDIRTAVKLLYRPGDVVEIRAFGPGGVRRVGRYEFGWALANAAAAEDAAGNDVYLVLCPSTLPPSPIQDGAQGTREGDVKVRRFFLLDCDPIRPNKRATDEEFARALDVAKKARAHILEITGTLPILASSGNGAHLLVPIADFPNDPIHKERIKQFQKVIAKKFSTTEVVIECFCDAARLTRCYGSFNKKQGGPSETWRKSGIL